MISHGDPVATLAGDTGVVWGSDRNASRVIVSWDDGRTTLEPVAMLLTDVGACSHGRPHSGSWCGAPTWPGFERCALHGGADAR